MNTPDIAIRLRRATFNRALAEADIGAIGPLLTPETILVTGTDSAIIAGRKSQLNAWRREFAAPDRVIYTRFPDSIDVSPVEPIAFEHGRWQGITRSGQPVGSGTYVAKWRMGKDDWVIEAEMYLTLGITLNDGV